MENPTEKESKTTPGTFKEKLNKTQQEIEELAVQFSLGKAEAKDKFEEVKKDLLSKLQQWKNTDIKSSVNEKTVELKTKMEELSVQLALGKAEAKEVFEEQKKKISHSLTNLENEIRNHPDLKESYADLKNEIEKFRLKLEILKLKFGLKKFELSDSFRKEMNEAKENISEIFASAEDKWKKSKSKFSDFSDETELAYKHLKNAFKSFGK